MLYQYLYWWTERLFYNEVMRVLLVTCDTRIQIYQEMLSYPWTGDTQGKETFLARSAVMLNIYVGRKTKTTLSFTTSISTYFLQDHQVKYFTRWLLKKYVKIEIVKTSSFSFSSGVQVFKHSWFNTKILSILRSSLF